MSEHQESLKQVVARIEASFVKIKSYGEKVDQFRISAGKQLVELKVRIEAGEAGKGVKWWSWYAEHFKNRTQRDAQRVMALARADDPEAAAEEERARNRKAVAAHRERKDEEKAEATYSKSHQLTEEDFAAMIVRGIEEEVADLEGEVADLDLVRELILQKLTFAFGRKEESAEARKIEEVKKRPGRPPGSKNKPKEAAPPTAPAQANGNDVDTEAATEARKAANAAMEESVEQPAPPPPDDSLDIRGTFMDRRDERPYETGTPA